MLSLRLDLLQVRDLEEHARKQAEERKPVALHGLVLVHYHHVVEELVHEGAHGRNLVQRLAVPPAVYHGVDVVLYVQVVSEEVLLRELLQERFVELPRIAFGYYVRDPLERRYERAELGGLPELRYGRDPAPRVYD